MSTGPFLIGNELCLRFNRDLIEAVNKCQRLLKGSEPGSEWLEIEQKITDFTKILGLAVTSPK